MASQELNNAIFSAFTFSKGEDLALLFCFTKLETWEDKNTISEIYEHIWRWDIGPCDAGTV